LSSRFLLLADQAEFGLGQTMEDPQDWTGERGAGPSPDLLSRAFAAMHAMAPSPVLRTSIPQSENFDLCEARAFNVVSFLSSV
jgi:hypothetical protein